MSTSFRFLNPFAGLRWVGVACLVVTTNAAWAQQGAGRVMAVNGIAKAVNTQGQERALEKGAEVFAGEKIVTGEGGLVQMRLHDGGYLSVRSSTEMAIDRFTYDEKDASKSNFLVSLVRGGFRSITGMIGRTNPAAYQIRTTTATLGVRGTDHEPMVIPEGLAGIGGAAPQPGIYDKVNDGETFIQNKFGVLALKRGDVGFAPAKLDVAPQVLQKVPDFYKVEVKTDARDAKDVSVDDKPAARTVSKGLLLRPTLAIRKDATLSDPAQTGSTSTTLKTLDSTTTLQVAPVISDSTTLKTTTLAEPITTTTTTSTLTSPTLSTSTLSTSTLSTTTLSTSTLSTSTLISPTTSTLTTTISPTTTLSPTTTTTTTISPTTTLIAPKTTTTLSTTTLIK